MEKARSGGDVTKEPPALEQLKAQSLKIQEVMKQKDGGAKPSDFTFAGKAAPTDKHLFLETFNVKQQHILNQYGLGHLTLDQLDSLYNSAETLHDAASLSSVPQKEARTPSLKAPFVRENHDILTHYHLLLDLARDMNIKVQAGFPPKGLVELMMSHGTKHTSDMLEDVFPILPAQKNTEISLKNTLGHPLFIEGSEEHYDRYKKACMKMYNEIRPRSQFDARVFEDSVMAAKIVQTVVNSPSDDVNLMVVAKNIHVDYGFGIPERVRKLCQIYDIELQDMIVTTRNFNRDIDARDSPGEFVLYYEPEE